jgi:hypothetical protein
LKYCVFRVLALSLLLLPGLFWFNACSPADPTQPPVELVLPNGAKAAIIDQLNPSQPDPDFIAQATAILQSNGLRVDYWGGDQVTLDLYRRLPGLGYSLIIFRAHAGLLGNGRQVDQKTCLYTNQPYGQTAAMVDQILNRVVKAGVDNEAPLFGIGADFISHSLQGRLAAPAVIMMGCRSLEKNDLAQAFIGKGAAVYTGWNENLGLFYSEDVTLSLLNKVVSEKLPVASAIKLIMQEKGPDPETGAELRCYPEYSFNSLTSAARP